MPCPTGRQTNKKISNFSCFYSSAIKIILHQYKHTVLSFNSTIILGAVLSTQCLIEVRVCTLQVKITYRIRWDKWVQDKKSERNERIADVELSTEKFTACLVTPFKLPILWISQTSPCNISQLPYPYSAIYLWGCEANHLTSLNLSFPISQLG